MDCGLCNAQKEMYRVIYENDHAFCVVDKSPLKAGHILVLPKKHRTSLTSLEHNEYSALFCLVEKMKPVVKRASGGEDPIIHVNTGKHSTEEHIHIHLVPSKGGLRPLVSSFEGVPERAEASQERMEELKEEILKIMKE